MLIHGVRGFPATNLTSDSIHQNEHKKFIGHGT